MVHLPRPPGNEHLLSRIKHRLNIDQSIVIGMFGYISPYKGHLEALKAMRCLPAQYVLMIFGRQHPQTMLQNAIDPYLDALVKEVYEHPDLRERVFFMGELGDEDFIEIATQIDIVWLPYYENGQDGSGIASMCCDVSKRVLVSASSTFDELFALIPYQHIQRFDVGNYLEMAQKTKYCMEDSPMRSGLDLDAETLDLNRIYSLKSQADLYVRDLAAQK